MSESIPSLVPGNTSSTGAAATVAGAPTALPPTIITSGNTKCGCSNGAADPRNVGLPVGANPSSLQAPSLRPGSASAAGAVTATWHSNVHVVGLWSINQDRNCWVYLDNVGWRNVSGTSESGLVAMNMLATHAYQLGATSSLYEGDDGRISQLYVW